LLAPNVKPIPSMMLAKINAKTKKINTGKYSNSITILLYPINKLHTIITTLASLLGYICKYNN